MSGLLQGSLSSLSRKYIMAGTGLMLGAFLLFHALGNSFIFQGKRAFNAYAEHLHSSGVLIPISESLLLVVFLLHVVTGITLFLDNQDARGGRYAANRSAGRRTWVSRTMPLTGLIILGFLFFHLSTLRFVAHPASVADTVIQVLGTPSSSLFYFLGVTALGLHISHGFWSLFQSMGIHHPRYNGLIRVTAYSVGGLIIGIFELIIFYYILTR